MSWFRLEDAERKEWREHPTTKAYFEALADQVKDAKDDIVSALVDGSEEAINNALRMAGRIDGFETAIKIMEKDE